MQRCLKWLSAVGLALVCNLPVAQAQPVAVEAVGIAFVSSPADKEAARRRALGDALVSAALAGGANMQGYSALTAGRLTSDFSQLQAAGRVLSHQVLSAQLSNGQWQVRVRARVGPRQTGACGSVRHLTVSATPPRISIDPAAPPWTAPLAGKVAHGVMQVLHKHPRTSLESVAPVLATREQTDTLDYTTLTRGSSIQPQGNHRFVHEIKVVRDRKHIMLTLGLSIVGSDGERLIRHFKRSAAIPRGGLGGLLSGRGRLTAEHHLTDGLFEEVSATLTDMTCHAPQARLQVTGGALQVPLGARHGLSRSTLAIVEDRNASFRLLEIVTLHDRTAVLRPLDPTRSLQSYQGVQIYFVEAGL